MDAQIGLKPEDTKTVSENLSRFLADTYSLYLKTQFFHWNVRGMNFKTLHMLFEEQYSELAVAIDEIAERITALGAVAPGSFSMYQELMHIEQGDDVPEDKEMLRQLARDNEHIIKAARAMIEISQKAGDEATADLLIKRLDAHEKAGWMLRATLG